MCDRGTGQTNHHRETKLSDASETATLQTMAMADHCIKQYEHNDGIANKDHAPTVTETLVQCTHMI